MTCESVQRWLDDGMPAGADAAAAHAHAGACARCTAELAAARELDALLESPARPAPAGFAAQVMARVEAVEAVRSANSAAAMLEVGVPLAWWVRAAAQPAAALAFALAGLVLWQRALLTTYASMLVARAGGWVAGAISASHAIAAPVAAFAPPAAFARPEVVLGIAFALAPFMAWGSWRLWSWAERRA